MSEKNSELNNFDPEEWNAFCTSLQQAGKTILSNAPNDGLERTEGFRYLARLTAHALGRFVEKRDPFQPTFDYNSPRIGGDNPDFIYGSATIKGDCSYRIWGNREETSNIGFGAYSGGLGSGKGLVCNGYLHLNEMEIDDNGDFEIIVSQQQQSGNWLPLQAESNAILVRQTLLDRLSHRSATLNIALQSPLNTPTHTAEILDGQTFSKALQLSGLFVGGVVDQFLNWTNTFKNKPNQLLPIDPALLQFAQGDPETRYHNGYFSLQEGEALLIELSPPNCEYWNIQATNHWLESLDYLHHQTHINRANAKASPDGVIRVVVSKTNPEVDNWIDTAGHDCGCLSMRWVKADKDSLAVTRLMTLQALKSYLREKANA